MKDNRMALASRAAMERWRAEYLESLAHWCDLRWNGGSDLFWEDGVNMALVRNHCIYYRRLIIEWFVAHDPTWKPKGMTFPIPPKFPQDYVAKSNRERFRAERAEDRAWQEENAREQARRLVGTQISIFDSEAARQKEGRAMNGVTING